MEPWSSQTNLANVPDLDGINHSIIVRIFLVLFLVTVLDLVLGAEKEIMTAWRDKEREIDYSA